MFTSGRKRGARKHLVKESIAQQRRHSSVPPSTLSNTFCNPYPESLLFVPRHEKSIDQSVPTTFLESELGFPNGIVQFAPDSTSDHVPSSICSMSRSINAPSPGCCFIAVRPFGKASLEISVPSIFQDQWRHYHYITYVIGVRLRFSFCLSSCLYLKLPCQHILTTWQASKFPSELCIHKSILLNSGERLAIFSNSVKEPIRLQED